MIQLPASSIAKNLMRFQALLGLWACMGAWALAQQVPPAPLPPAPLPAGETASPPPAAPKEAEPDDSAFLESERLKTGGTQQELSAAQAIADMERRRQKRKSAISRARVRNLQSYEYELTGKTEKEIIREATVRGLKSTASRLYFGNYILIGRDVLEPYLTLHGDKFVLGREVLEREVLADGSLRMRVKVGVDVDALYDDLQEKKFIAKPKVRPIVAVSIAETKNGEPQTDGRARLLLERALAKSELRVESSRLEPFGLEQNVAASPEVLRNAREEAQRGDVDVIITGAFSVEAKREEVILFDQVFYTAGKLDLKLVRVDTGEVVRSYSDSYSTAGPTAEASVTNLLNAMVGRAAEGISKDFQAQWTNTMLDKGDYRLIISGVTPEILATVSDQIKALSPGVQLFVKANYGDVVVMNLLYPGSKPREVESFLRQSRLPQFKVRAADERHFELDAL